MAFHLPNPYQEQTAITQVGARAGLHDMPKTKYGSNDFSEAGAKILKAMSDWQDEIDTTNVQAAVNESKIKLNNLRDNPEDGWAHQLGTNALDRSDGQSLQQEYLGRWNAIAKEQRSKLKTARAQAAFDKFATEQTYALRQNLDAHVIKQQIAKSQAEDMQSLQLAAQDMTSGDWKSAQSASVAMDALIQRQADKQGLPVDQWKIKGEAHVAAVQSFLEKGNASAASAWYKQYQEEMSPKQRKQAKSYIDSVIMDGRVNSYASQLMATYDPERPFDLMQKVDAIKDEKVRKRVAARVNQAVRHQEALRKAEISQLGRDLIGQMEQTGSFDPVDMARLKAISPELHSKLESMYLNNGGQAAPAKSDPVLVDDLNEQFHEDPDGFVARVSDPAVLARLSISDRERMRSRADRAKDRTFRAFHDELEKAMQMNGVKKKNRDLRARIVAMADKEYEFAVSQSDKAMLDKEARKELINSLFEKSGGWFAWSGDPRYEHLWDAGGDVYAANKAASTSSKAWSPKALQGGAVESVYRHYNRDMKDATPQQREWLNVFYEHGSMPPKLREAVERIYRDKGIKPTNNQIIDGCLRAIVTGVAEKGLKE